MLLTLGDHAPRLGSDVFIAPNATVIGDVEIEELASIWFGVVVRGDIGPIRIGARTNIQDLSCLHLTENVSVTTIGADVTVGHGAILHGCIVEDRSLVGMGAVVLDGARIGTGSLVAAGALVPPRMVVPPRSLVRGNPGRVIRQVTAEETEMIESGAAHYVANGRRFRAALG